MKLIYLTIAFAAVVMFKAQVGINTDNPKSTLDVSAKRDNTGSITDNEQFVGLQSPRLSREELSKNTAAYGTDQTAALIYVTDIIGGDTNVPRTNVDSPGYYYFDGVLWQKFVGGNSQNEAIEPWQVRASDTKATLNTQDIYQNGNVAVGTKQGVGTFHVDASKNNSTTEAPTVIQALDDVVVTSGGRIGFGYSPSDQSLFSYQYDDKVTFQGNNDLDVNYSLATTNNAQAIVHRNIISSGQIGSRTARPRGTSIVALEGHTSTSDSNFGFAPLNTQQRAGVVLRTGKYSDLGGEIWLGTSGYNSDGTTATRASNMYRAIMDEKGNWSLGADPTEPFYRNPSQRLDLILGGVRIDALGYGTLAAWQTLQSNQRPNYISTDPNDRIVVVDANGVLKTINRSDLNTTSTAKRTNEASSFNIINNSSDITPAIVKNCQVYESEAIAQNDNALFEGSLYRITGSGVLRIKY